jgi:LysR family transcriptional regulator, transcriptional activator for bauABCD operon
MASSKQKSDYFLRQLDWNLLKTFAILVEARSLTRTAQRMGRRQPAISLALKRLEDGLGARLCLRGPGGFELTEEGKRLAEICNQMNALIRLLPDDVAGSTHQVSSPIRIRLISNLVSRFLDDVIASLHDAYPQVALLIDVASWSEVVDSLLRQEIDIGVAPLQSKRTELSYWPLFKEVHRPFCGRGHPLYGKTVTNPRELANEAFILTGADEPDQLSNFRLKHGLGKNVAGVSKHLEEARRLAILGVGLCFLPEDYAAPDVVEGRLWPLLGKRGLPAMEIFVITNPNGPLHLSSRLLIDKIQSVIGAGQPHLAARPR